MAPRLLVLSELGFSGIFLAEVGALEFLLEFLDPAGGIDKLLLAGEERVALVADIDVQ